MRMALFRLWAWRFAMLASAVTTAFFAVMAVAPFETVGEPVFDAVMIRARYWDKNGFALVQLFGVGLWLVTAATAGQWVRGVKALAVAVVLFACIVAMASEYGSLIQSGALRDPVAVAQHKLMVSRGITLTLALLSLGLGWWARPLLSGKRPT
jgi:hypothetical protein